jgi:hypothetical protein
VGMLATYHTSMCTPKRGCASGAWLPLSEGATLRRAGPDGAAHDQPGVQTLLHRARVLHCMT